MEGREWRLEGGGWKLEARGWRLEAGDWRLEVGSWRLQAEAEGWREEAAGCRLEVGGCKGGCFSTIKKRWYLLWMAGFWMHQVPGLPLGGKGFQISCPRLQGWFFKKIGGHRMCDLILG